MSDYADRESLPEPDIASEEHQADLSDWQSPAEVFQAKLEARLSGQNFTSPLQKAFQAKLSQDSSQADSPPDQSDTPAVAPLDAANATSSVDKTLPSDVLQNLESTLDEDFSQVKIQESESATQIGALAYTQGEEITFAPGQFQPDTPQGQELIGHEFAHVKQQRENRVQPTTQTQGVPVNDEAHLEQEADDSGRTVANQIEVSPLQRKPDTRQVPEQNPPLQLKAAEAPEDPPHALVARWSDPAPISRDQVIQGNFISDLVNRIDSVPGLDVQDLIDAIPGYNLFTQITEYDILRDRNVQRDPRELIREFMELPPGGELLYRKLDEYGIIDGAYNWVVDELSRLNLTSNRVESALRTAWDLMDFVRLDVISYNLGVVQRQFAPLFRDVRTFASSAVDALIELLTEALTEPLVDYLYEENETYRLATKVLHRKFPLEDRVEASTEEIIRDFLLLIGKETEVQQMEERGTLTEMAEWIDTQWGRFTSLTDRFIGIVDQAWEAFSMENLSDIPGVFGGILDDFIALLEDFIEFASEVAAKVLELVKKALLGMLSEHASQTPGYPLIRVLLGKDPFTEEEVPRTATNIIHGFLSLLPGGEETFQRLQESGAIDRMVSWIDGAVSRLGITWDFIVNLFTDIWNSLSIDDLVNPIEAFVRIVSTFGEPIARLFEFIFEVIQAIVQFVLEVMNFPTQLIVNIVNNAMQAYEDIKQDPMGFFVNLFQAMKLGFEQFFTNIGTHLLSGLVDWLFGQMENAGITPPPDLSFESILNLVLEILGISQDQIMEKIAERIGEERMAQIQDFVDRAVGIFTLVGDVMERGPVALWEHIEQQLSNLWDMVIEGVRNWIMEQIITRVTARLLTMLDPTGIGAAINTAIAFFNAVQSFIEYLTEMLEIINSFVEGVANIARGSLNQAADFLESALADGIPIAIGFLANQVGLSGLGERIGEMIQALQERVDQAIDRVLDWIAEQMRNIMQSMGLMEEEEEDPESAENSEVDEADLRQSFSTQDGDRHNLYVPEGETHPMVASTPKTLDQLVSERRTQIQQENTDNPAGTAENQPKLDALGRITQNRTELVSLLSQYNVAVDRSSSRQATELASQINAKMNAIVEDLIVAGIDTEGSDNIETHVTHQLDAGRPKTVIAEPLTPIPGNTVGSTPQEEPLGWDYLDPSKRRSHWVAAHLLNHHLHGPGLQWNLVPGTKETNNNMKTEIENTAKDEVSSNPDKQYFYEVNVDYLSEQPGKPYLQYFPFQIRVQFGELNGEVGNFNRGPAREVSFTQDSPDVTNTSMPSFNESSASRLKTASDDAGKSIPASVFSNIVAARRQISSNSFGESIEELITHMEAYYVSNGLAAQGVFTQRFGGPLRELAANFIFMNY